MYRSLSFSSRPIRSLGPTTSRVSVNGLTASSPLPCHHPTTVNQIRTSQRLKKRPAQGPNPPLGSSSSLAVPRAAQLQPIHSLLAQANPSLGSSLSVAQRYNHPDLRPKPIPIQPRLERQGRPEHRPKSRLDVNRPSHQVRGVPVLLLLVL